MKQQNTFNIQNFDRRQDDQQQDDNSWNEKAHRRTMN